MHLQPTILATPNAIGDHVAHLIVTAIANRPNQPYLLGCPSGRTAMPVYAALERAAREGHDLSRLVVVLMDDYVVQHPDHGINLVAEHEAHSCLGFAKRTILTPIARAAAAAGTTPPQEIWWPDPNAPETYDERIATAGGIDLFLLASGESDGHVAFNQPGTPADTPTHIATLGTATRRDNMNTFPTFGSLDDVPTHGISVGVGTIARHSASVAMILTGTHKQDAYRHIKAATGYDSNWPATIVHDCRQPHLLVDEAAAGLT